MSIPEAWQLALLFLVSVAGGIVVSWPLSSYLRPHPPSCDRIAYFEPQPDITAYEVAEVFAKRTGWTTVYCVDAKHPIPAEFARHFRFEKP